WSSRRLAFSFSGLCTIFAWRIKRDHTVSPESTKMAKISYFGHQRRSRTPVPFHWGFRPQTVHRDPRNVAGALTGLSALPKDLNLSACASHPSSEARIVQKSSERFRSARYAKGIVK